MRNTALYTKTGYREAGLFVYRGTAALKKGHGMCYDLDYLTTETGETATDKFGKRGLIEVQLPNQNNNLAFAGVLTQDYEANPNAHERLVELALPGSVCEIAGVIPTTINSTRLTCIVPSALQNTAGYTTTAGKFGPAGLPGRGTAIALQTRAAAGPWVNKIAGEAAYATATGTITCTGAFANAAANDKVVILSGGVANAAKAGTYFIKTVTDDDNAIISDTLGGDAYLTAATNAAKIAISVIPAGDPLTLAYLCDGEESGLVEFDIPVSAAVTNPMVGGWTNLMGNVTLASDHTPPIVDGLFPGMKKTVKLHGAITDSSYAITPASLGLAPDGAIAVTATLQATLGQADLEFTGQKWDIKSVAVAATAT